MTSRQISMKNKKSPSVKTTAKKLDWFHHLFIGLTDHHFVVRPIEPSDHHNHHPDNHRSDFHMDDKQKKVVEA